jgi:cardiolipin synthase
MAEPLAVLFGALLVIVAGTLVLYFTRDTTVQRVRWLDEDEGYVEGLDLGTPLFEEALRLYTETPLVPGHHLDVLANGDETYPRLWDDLGAATSLITWQVFWFKPGRLADHVHEVLVERARAGVRVLFLLDAVGCRGIGDDYVQSMRDAGVEVALFRPFRWRDLYKVQQRMHVRSVVIDGEIGYTGGFGIDDRWMGGGRATDQWRDTNVRIQGPVVDRLQITFAANWAEATGELILGRGVHSIHHRASTGELEVGIVHCVPSLGSTTAERLYVLVIAGAQHRLWITNPYFVPSRTQRRLLVEAAQRNVDVRILTPGRNSDRRSAYLAGRAHYESLLEGGVRIYEYQPAMVHAKTIVADGCLSSIGTVNFDNRSMKLNDEVAAVTNDPATAGRLEHLFERDLEFAQAVSLDELRARGWTARLAERMAHLVAPVL